MEYVSDFLVGFLTAQLSVAGAPILIREIVGNLFGLACAFLGICLLYTSDAADE